MARNTDDQGCHFLGLYPELRERVYSFCFADGDLSQRENDELRPREPAITQVSKSIRAEALPLFYGAYPMTFQTYIEASSHGDVWVDSDSWFHRLSPCKLGWLRNFTVCFAFAWRYFGEPVSITFTIQLDKRSNHFSLSHSFGGGWCPDANRSGDPTKLEQYREKTWTVLTEHLTKSLTDSLRDVGVGGLRASDIDHLVDIAPESLPLS